MVAQAAARQVLGMTLKELALLFGRPGKDCSGDHSAVIYAINRVLQSDHLTGTVNALVRAWKESNQTVAS